VHSAKLVPLRAPISNGALTADALPARLKVLGWGDNPSVKGVVTLSDFSVSRLPARQAETGFDRIALDFEHNTVPGSPEFDRTSEPRAVAAYGTPRIVPGDGLFLEQLQWTPAGKSAALNYADLSPAVELDERGNIIFVHSVALTRAGAVEGLSFFNVNLPTPNQKTMPEKFLTLAAMAAMLGLNESAEEAAVTAEFKKRLTPPAPPDLTTLSARIEALEKKAPAAPAAGPELTALAARVKALEDGIASGNAAVIERERADLLGRFSAEGKVPLNAGGLAYSADELQKLDVPTLKLLHANTPATVPLHARGPRARGGKNFGDLKGLEKAIAAHAAGQ